MQALQIGTVACASISLLLLLIALGSDYWVGNALSNTGLWKLCLYDGSFSTCHSYGMNVEAQNGCYGHLTPFFLSLPSFLKDFLHATRAFMFLGMIAGAVSCIGLCGTFIGLQLGSISKAKASAIASFVAALCVLIAMATFTGRLGTEVSYGWSFGLGWASFPLFLITGEYV
ncbi:peripheral myelin protein 22-like [Lacerta agilis]|uniref:peripheral myelin protein 22-like n=1 Tax=Lacerta agilis TaxID=80427 RepID=UPI001419850C|nr:peripheral myelin protein 22-like [Lacerta agilis]